MNDSSQGDLLSRRETIVAVIDDDHDSLTLISEFLRQAVIQAVTFSSAKEALKHLPDLHPDCVLVDFMMPEINGLELCLTLRDLPELRETPIIFLSADEDKKRVVQALTAGANDYLTKPLNAQELIVRIETHISLHLEKQRVEFQRRLLEKRNEENVVLNTRSMMLQEVLKQYTPRSTWEKADLSAGEGMVSIVDEEVDLTFLFLDIKGFTKFSDGNSAEKVIASLNQILGPVTDVLHEHDGDIDKFIGDSIFAIFKDPIQAVRAAFKARDAIRRTNHIRSAAGQAELPVRIGLNCGRVVRGNVGSAVRKENTVIGDAVNIASRIEHACEAGRVLISDALYSRVRGNVQVSRPYMLKAKGKSEMIRVFYLEGVAL